MNNEHVHNIISEELFAQMTKDRGVRRAITKQNFLYFFHFYYAHYVKYATADFQKEIIHFLERSDRENLYVVAFRGSGKSTMVTTAYPIWAILGMQEKKFVTIFCQTQAQAKLHMMNLRRELEHNALLKNDLGPFKEDSDEWGSYTLTFSHNGARIIVASAEQSIRGIRQGEHRPDLIICDDVEDINSTKTREGRDKTYNWLRGDVIPGGDKNTRLIIVGNLLHEDSLLMRIKAEVEEGRAKGVFKSYPLLDKDDVCLWPGKYPTEQDIEDERLRIASEAAWQREYLLRIIPSDDQVIYPEWIKFYDEIPSIEHVAYRGTYAGVDLAISAKDSADFTALVSARIYGRREKMHIYIEPNPFELKISFPEQVDLLKMFKNTRQPLSGDMLFVESVAYQEALPQMLDVHGIEAKAIKPKGDKRTRLALTSMSIKSGLIKFPRKGCEKLIQQLVGFGVEKHDDLADAFSLLINATIDYHADDSTWLMAWLDGPTIYHSDYVDVETGK